MQKVLKKILEELNKEKPDLSYIKGMLEVLIDDTPVSTTSGTNDIGIVPIRIPMANRTLTEQEILDRETEARLKIIQNVEPV